MTYQGNYKCTLKSNVTIDSNDLKCKDTKVVGKSVSHFLLAYILSLASLNDALLPETARGNEPFLLLLTNENSLS